MQMSDSVNGTISGYTTDSILTYRLYVSLASHSNSPLDFRFRKLQFR